MSTLAGAPCEEGALGAGCSSSCGRTSAARGPSPRFDETASRTSASRTSASRAAVLGGKAREAVFGGKAPSRTRIAASVVLIGWLKSTNRARAQRPPYCSARRLRWRCHCPFSSARRLSLSRAAAGSARRCHCPFSSARRGSRAAAGTAAACAGNATGSAPRWPRPCVRSLPGVLRPTLVAQTCPGGRTGWRRGPFLLYKVLYNTHASPRGPCVAIQLYSAMHYTAIHRYTLYRLYNTPLIHTRRPTPTLTEWIASFQASSCVA